MKASTIVLVSILPAACESSAIPPPPSVVHRAIVDGQRDDDATNVVVVLRFNEDGTPGPFAAGALIAPNVVMTTKSIVSEVIPFGADPCRMKVGDPIAPERLGVMRATEFRTNPHKEIEVREVRAAPPPQSIESEICGRNLALLVLATNIDDIAPFGVRMSRPLKPATSENLGGGVFITLPGERYIHYGYGRLSADDAESRGVRRFAEAFALCEDGDFVCYPGMTLGEWAGDGAACIGDAGGPAIIDGQVVGIASRAQPDCSSSVFQSMFAWGPWITRTLLAIAADTGVAAPRWVADVVCGADSDCPDGQACHEQVCVEEAYVPRSDPEPHPDLGPETATPEPRPEPGPEPTPEVSEPSSGDTETEPAPRPARDDDGCAGGGGGPCVLALGILLALARGRSRLLPPRLSRPVADARVLRTR